MKNILKILVFNVNILILIIGINYYGDVAHLFQYSIEENIALNLLDNNVVVLPDIYDERIERTNFIREQKIIPNMAVIGSSSVRLITKYNSCELINYGMSGADFWDYIGIVGALDYYEKMPKEILIGIDPNAFVAGKRSNSIKNYIEYEKKIINTNGVQRESVQVSIGSTDWEKIIDLISINNFKESLRSLIEKNNIIIELSDDEPDKGDKIIKLRPDGSYILPRKVTERQEDEIRDIVIERLNVVNYSRLPQLDDRELFETFIKSLQGRGIKVYIYLPPVSPLFYSEMIKHQEWSEADSLERYLMQFAKEQNIKIYGSYNGANLGLKVADFVDTGHLKSLRQVEQAMLLNK